MLLFEKASFFILFKETSSVSTKYPCFVEKLVEPELEKIFKFPSYVAKFVLKVFPNLSIAITLSLSVKKFLVLSYSA